MPRKSGLIIKKEILKVIREKPISLRKIETKLHTNYKTIRKHCEELEYFGLIKLVRHKANPINNKPYVTV